jgi:hypothetical protein
MPTERMGPPPGASPPMRMTASWSGSNDPTAYKSVARNAPKELPSDPQHRQAPTRARSYAKAVSQFIIAPRAQASRRCETQAPLRRQAAKLCYRFGPLTPSARSANLIAGDGTKNGFPGRVEDWRASWPRIPDRPRFQPPPRRTQHADFPHCAPPFASRQGLWDLSYRGNFRSVVSHSIAVEQP